MMGLLKYKDWTLQELEDRKRVLDLKIEVESWEELEEYENLKEELFYRANPIRPESLSSLDFE